MKKKLVLFCMAGLLLFSLCACGGKEEVNIPQTDEGGVMEVCPQCSKEFDIALYGTCPECNLFKLADPQNPESGLVICPKCDTTFDFSFFDTCPQCGYQGTTDVESSSSSSETTAKMKKCPNCSITYDGSFYKDCPWCNPNAGTTASSETTAKMKKCPNCSITYDGSFYRDCPWCNPNAGTGENKVTSVPEMKPESSGNASSAVADKKEEAKPEKPNNVSSGTKEPVVVCSQCSVTFDETAHDYCPWCGYNGKAAPFNEIAGTWYCKDYGAMLILGTDLSYELRYGMELDEQGSYTAKDGILSVKATDIWGNCTDDDSEYTISGDVLSVWDERFERIGKATTIEHDFSGAWRYVDGTKPFELANCTYPYADILRLYRDGSLTVESEGEVLEDGRYAIIRDGDGLAIDVKKGDEIFEVTFVRHGVMILVDERGAQHIFSLLV